MPNESATEVTGLLLNELKLKREELDVAKMGERKTAERLSKWKQRAKAAEAERDELRIALRENAESMGIENIRTIYKQRALDAEASLAEYKERASDEKFAHQKTMEDLQRLEKELAQVRKSELNDSVNPIVSKLARYKQRPEEAEPVRKIADYESLQSEMAEVNPGSVAKLGMKLQAQIAGIERADEQISRALDCLPLVEGHPGANLKAIGGPCLALTIGRLSESTRLGASWTQQRWKRHSFTEHEVLFTDSLQHGYMLRPRKWVKFKEKTGKATWSLANPLDSIFEPFEFLFQKTGLWYYIGTYRAFYICEAPQETLRRWSSEGMSTLVNATITGASKNSKLKEQYHREVQEKYASGELIAGYVAIQCVGFNHILYHELQQAWEATSKKGKKRTLTDGQCIELGSDTSHKRRRTEDTQTGSSRS